ncbi:MAG: pyrroline-5-carboxylate reductase [Deltaproteobacteria bacterium]|nr:pyrroline-5-carboxylate reductase [Deltaproteobacteria bacterium]MBW2359921.1 pyrroline-5-carboxylate reductase [Deltaproteobacteria bacterium]
MSSADVRIGFLGGGAMAEALLGGLLADGIDASLLRAADPEPARRKHLSEALGIATSAVNAEVAEASDVLVLAVKPGMVTPVLESLASGGFDCTRPLWISIAAGVTLAGLEATLGTGARVVRAMPNTPALVGEGATGFCGNAGATDADLSAARSLFESVGHAWGAQSEAQLDAVTGLSGSGPAYLFAFLEALIAAGEAEGLPRAASEELVLQTAFGAAKLARESERAPAELRRQVSSPGGTTLAGLKQLEERGFAEALGAAVRAATQRAGELGRGE